MQPIHKSEGFINTLKYNISKGNVSNELDLRYHLRLVGECFNGLEKNYVMALIYSLHNIIDKAKYYFELSLQLPNIDYAHDYLAVINLRSTYKESKALAERLASEYNSINFLLFAYQANLYMADIKSAELFLCEIIELSSEDDRIQYMIDFNKSKNALIKYQEISGMQENDIKVLAEIVVSVLDDNQIPIITINYISSGNDKEKINTCRVTAESDDPQLLADMNMQLSYKLASYDVFLDKIFSVLILGVEDLSSICRRIKWL